MVIVLETLNPGIVVDRIVPKDAVGILPGESEINPQPEGEAIAVMTEFTASIARAGDAALNASALWYQYVRVSGYGTSSPRSIAEKLPLWSALLLVAGVGILAVRRGASEARLP